jgi:gliding motility-associated-like protein
MQSSSTDTSKNLHLDTNQIEIHNKYIGWENGVLQYALELFEGSTWNETKNKPDVFVKEDIKEVQNCFRITATADNNPTNVSVSHSNEVCPKKRLNYYITTGLNPNGVNKRFVVRGEGLDYVLSTFQIYNRWGELIKSGTLNEEWDGSYQNKVVNSGIYLYVVKIYGINGEFEQAKGVVSVIK